ncbi:MAG: family 20 glycosylhydrolase [Cyclobacteriaceae bacterium]
MKFNLSALFILFIILITAGCGEPRPQLETPSDLASSPVIPLPPQMTSAGGGYFLDENTTIYVQDSTALDVAGDLQEMLESHLGTTPSIELSPDPDEEGIVLRLTEDGSMTEGYTLSIMEDRTLISAGSPAGLFYALQTLKQVIVNDEKYVYFPTGEISDEPVYGYRGIMLDVARHFFTVEEVKRTIDYLAFYKLNHLHLHLSDDQGWRIEIKSWPS